jgi:L-alanine-DL-glutamate epimerase-like enolase superfamily enzyme
VSIAAYVAPLSHGACQPVRNSVLGQTLNDSTDIERIAKLVARNSMDLLQAPHTWSGIEIALWDLLGKKSQAPVWSLLGDEQVYPKTPYASVLFGDTAQQTLERAQRLISRGFTAAKFGWGNFGVLSVQNDRDQLDAAREGLGPDATLLVDAGQIWQEDVAAAAARLDALEEVNATWLEEPFYAGALVEYAELKKMCRSLKIAGAEAAHNAAVSTPRALSPRDKSCVDISDPATRSGM